ncbi:MAG: hypothetical protein GQ578_09965 [Desulfuromonadaceae bacterium]|nr:hypothetical protein [Desulfuromonadaceae bacterium]
MKVALIEKNDFSEGVGSRSVELVHGGVRYLEMAVKKKRLSLSDPHPKMLYL